MHEVGVAKEVLSIVLEKACGRRIMNIKVELGNDGHTTPESFSHAFDMVSAGTLAQGAKLEVLRGRDIESRVIEFYVQKE